MENVNKIDTSYKAILTNLTVMGLSYANLLIVLYAISKIMTLSQ